MNHNERLKLELELNKESRIDIEPKIGIKDTPKQYDDLIMSLYKWYNTIRLLGNEFPCCVSVVYHEQCNYGLVIYKIYKDIAIPKYVNNIIINISSTDYKGYNIKVKSSQLAKSKLSYKGFINAVQHKAIDLNIDLCVWLEGWYIKLVESLVKEIAKIDVSDIETREAIYKMAIDLKLAFLSYVLNTHAAKIETKDKKDIDNMDNLIYNIEVCTDTLYSVRTKIASVINAVDSLYQNMTSLYKIFEKYNIDKN